jgi:hypothetical protein
MYLVLKCSCIRGMRTNLNVNFRLIAYIYELIFCSVIEIRRMQIHLNLKIFYGANFRHFDHLGQQDVTITKLH